MRAMSTQGCSPEHLDFSISVDSPVFLLRPHPNPFLPVFPSHKQLKLTG
jgi:hypothetical protein